MSKPDFTTLSVSDLPVSDSAAPSPRPRRRVRSAAEKTAARVAPIVPPVSASTSPAGLWQQFSNWFWSVAAAGYGISVLIHLVLLLSLSFVVFRDVIQNYAPLETSMGGSGEVEGMQDVLDISMDVPAASDLAGMESLDNIASTVTDSSALNNAAPMASGVETSLNALFGTPGGTDGEGGGGDGSGMGVGSGSFLAPDGARVFRKGNFTAWTVPNDPGPAEAYNIVILVKLPKRVTRYRASDLSGMVIGTDGYRQTIPGAEYVRGRVYLPMQDNMAQLVIPVPGGAARVKDRIEIRSSTLNEQQTLNIEF